MNKYVFVLSHTYDESELNYKILGIFSDEEKAEIALAIYYHTAGFAAHKDGFNISRYELDKKHWVEGFAT